MAWSLDKLNLLKLSGTRSVLGIELGRSRARVVELGCSKGGLVNKFRARFTVQSYFTVGFEEGMDRSRKARLLSEAIAEHGIKTRYASSAIQGMGVRLVAAEIPRTASADITGWITDHAEKLLRLPIPVKELVFGWEILSENEHSLSAEITFVRKEDVKAAEDFFTDAGLTLLSLTAGMRDALNPLFYDEEFLRSERYTFAWLGAEDAFFAEYENRKRTRAIFCAEQDECDLTRSGSLHVAGETEGVEARLVEPFSVTSEYMLAVGCALKGWVDELHTVNFHSERYAEKKKEDLGKALFYRITIFSGLLLALLLGMEIAGGLILDHFYEKCETTLLESGVNYSELNALEKDNRALKEELEKAGSLAYRSEYARVLHEVAGATPRGVWLSRLRIDRKDVKSGKLTIEGSARASENVSDFLRELEGRELFKDVRLLKSGVVAENPAGAAAVVDGRASSPGVMTFVIALRIR